jgi:hypothetical protein
LRGTAPGCVDQLGHLPLEPGHVVPHVAQLREPVELLKPFETIETEDLEEEWKPRQDHSTWVYHRLTRKACTVYV